jgi:hypothetical protein
MNDKKREASRQATINFFKSSLGFKDSEIIFIDMKEFVKIDDYTWLTNFSEETQKKLNDFAMSIFTEKEHGLAKQILNIAISEVENIVNDASNYFSMTSNFELCIKLGEEFTEENAKKYFAKLDSKIKSEGLSEISF